MRPGKFVAIAGNIGVGKTHLTTLLANHLGWRAYYEPVIDNPYLDDFYCDMDRWSFHLQVFFLSKRFEIHREMVSSDEPCIQDRTIYEDKEIFAHTLHRQGFMSDSDYENYTDLFDAMTSFLRTPDLVVYLRAGVETLQERIRCRGRDCEREISSEYLRGAEPRLRGLVRAGGPDHGSADDRHGGPRSGAGRGCRGARPREGWWDASGRPCGRTSPSGSASSSRAFSPCCRAGVPAQRPPEPCALPRT